ncbi:MAG: hypothetical protein M3460_14440 [Actinomycetota bacterium]|nr:hypothetical protein [Actinomycetota bacterium]
MTSWVATAHQIAVRAWSWLDAAREHFALPSDFSCDQLHPNENIKPLGELALAASIAIREGATGSREAQIARALVEFAWVQLRGGEVLYDLTRDHSVDTYPMETYTWFVRIGYRHPRLDELLTHLTSLRAARVPEVVPNRALAVFNAERLLDLPQRQDPVALTARTWLGGTPEPWRTDFFTLYSMTHTVFHLTDWSARPEGLPAHLQAYLHAWLPAWLEVYLEAGQWDLVGELLIVDSCLTEPDDYPHAWDALARAQQPDGLMPNGPQRVPLEIAKAFRNHYHPTVVAATAGALTFSRQIDVRTAR